MRLGFPVLLVSLCLALSARLSATINITYGGASSDTTYDLTGPGYAQSFDSLPPSGTFTWTNDSTLAGWYAVPGSGSLNPAAITTDGGSNPTNLVLASVGTAGSAERALSYHTQLATAPTYLGLGFLNQSERELTSFTLSYTPEQWREATNSRSVTVSVQYRVGATLADLPSASGWTPIAGLDFSTLNGSVGATLTRSATVADLAIPSGSTLWIRWVFLNTATTATNSHDLLAIDNVAFAAAYALADNPPLFNVQPTSQTVLPGGSVTFVSEAVGFPAPTFQWFHGEDPIPGATSASLTVSEAAFADGGEYHVVATNSHGSTPSDTVTLTISTALPPVVATPPSDQTANTGAGATFTVVATGDGPFTYQWRKDNSPLPGATAASLTLSGLRFSDAGSYDVVVTGPGGSTTSAAATLVVNGPPSITAHPAAQSVFVGAPATFTVTAVGTAPLAYQWRRGGDPLPGQTGPTLTLTNLQLADSGAAFDVVVTNSFGATPSAVATLTVTTELAWSAFDLQGFATVGSGTTGGGIVAETDAAYRKCYTAYDFVKAIYDSSKTAGAVRVIEIMNDLDLGYLEVDDATRALGNFRAHATPKLHPRLIATGVSLIDTSPKNGGLTIFSANGSTLRHTCLNIKNTSNIIVRNLRFDEMWEWDEASKGDYDSNDWDFIDLSNGGAVSNVWIDHCTFTKAYDGIADFKKGTQYVTMSWCRYVGDDGATNPNSFVRQQIAALEANRSSYAFYNFLRNNGFSVEDIVQIIQGHDKGHLMGATELDTQNDVLSATFHHQWFENIWDRCVPRLRGGQVHNYNIYVDDSVALVAKRLRDTRKAAMGAAAQSSLENTYSFNPFLNGSISTEGGALLVEKSVYIDCITPLRNNQTDPSNPAYTGKIKSIDSIYVFHNANGTTTSVRGDSTDAGNPMGPFQAAVIPFSWNTTDGSAPYPAPPMDDPENLLLTLQAGAGAGRLTWPKSNWLRTANADAPATAPTIVTSPQGSTLAAGQSATLSVVATGTAPLAYQWYLGASGDTTVTVGTNSASYTTPALSASASYWVRVSNSAGSADSAAALLVVPTAFETWAAGSGFSGGSATDDADGDGVPLLLEYALGLDPLVADASPAVRPALAPEPAQPGVLAFRFQRPTAITGVSYTVETASSLAGPWTATATEPALENTADGMDTLVVEFPAPAAAAALFARLRVTLAP